MPMENPSATEIEVAKATNDSQFHRWPPVDGGNQRRIRRSSWSRPMSAMTSRLRRLPA
ncbi:hypothetical protein ACSYDW_10000 [Paeniglutamicibacter sp. R2-26]|uniref:hypothetical protein n=1 Tax=Paeniglutamicibacter sp. R2-26 TaxID=3144417 RepID=UPI003EE4C7D3